MATMTYPSNAEQKRLDAQDILNQYVASERFVRGMATQTEDGFWLEKAEYMTRRIAELRTELGAATPEP